MHGVFRIGPLTDECLIQSHSSLAVAGRAERGVSEWHRMTAEALKDCNKRRSRPTGEGQGDHRLARDEEGSVDPGAVGLAVRAVQESKKKKPRPRGRERRAAEEAGSAAAAATPRRGASARRVTWPRRRRTTRSTMPARKTGSSS